LHQTRKPSADFGIEIFVGASLNQAAKVRYARRSNYAEIGMQHA
jgi:hypothetical protein